MNKDLRPTLVHRFLAVIASPGLGQFQTSPRVGEHPRDAVGVRHPSAQPRRLSVNQLPPLANQTLPSFATATALMFTGSPSSGGQKTGRFPEQLPS